MNGNEDRRNPYLVLGLEYGSSVRDVSLAFARRSREVSQGRFSAYTTEDLTWALDQLERSHDDLEIDVSIYRVPANPYLFGSGPEASSGSGFFDPAPVPIGRTTGPTDLEEIEALLDEAVVSWVGVLLGPAGEPVQVPYPFPN